jgi:1-acyl-sn-glycerol-3-phosphate acyltransferase
MRESTPDDAAVPAVSRPLLRWFTWYSRRYLRKHFHSLRIAGNSPPPDNAGMPMVIYTNHASWWDPLACLAVAADFFPERTSYAPIDAAALERYRMFGRMGFFGVDRASRRSVLQFVRTARAILDAPGCILWITPQGRFADVRERPLRFDPGLGFIASRVERALFVQLATEFVFWEERLPEILMRFGDPVEVRVDAARCATSEEWTALFEQKLATCMDALAVDAQRRDTAAFQTVLRGGAGVSGIYDGWRRLRARLKGERFKGEHGEK